MLPHLISIQYFSYTNINGIYGRNLKLDYFLPPHLAQTHMILTRAPELPSGYLKPGHLLGKDVAADDDGGGGSVQETEKD